MRKKPSTYSYTTHEEKFKLHYGGGPKVCEHQIEEGACFTCLKDANADLRTEIEEAEQRGVDFWHRVEEREAGWMYALECRQARVREIRAENARLLAREVGYREALSAHEEDLEHDLDCDECTRLRQENTDWAAWPSCDEGLRLGNRAMNLRRAALAPAQGKCVKCDGRGFIVGVLPSEPPCPACAPAQEEEKK